MSRVLLFFICLHSLLLLSHGEEEGPMVSFALQRMREAHPEVQVKMKRESSLKAQGFEIKKEGADWLVSGGDDHGLMYGVLDLSESLTLGLEPSKKRSPSISRRGLKMNIPLDARCPSYDDSGTSAVKNIPVVWEREFWHQFLDRMAEHRYNVLTLWSNHPFTTMVKLKNYPEVAIPDVAVPTYEMDSHMLIQYRKEKLQNPKFYRVVKHMTMDEKIAHWRYVMRYARERGIDIYFITWNIWLHGAEGKYGISDSQKNPETIKYLRESMKQMVLTYPDLKGFGVTAGENMNNDLEGEHSPISWLWNTYGEGIKDALKEQPKRQFDFIHRVWYSGVGKMMEPFINKYPQRCDISFKYSRARLYSFEAPPFYKQKLARDVSQRGLRCWMNLRNDDIFHFRWGNPDYVRAFLSNLPKEPMLAGFYMGSDGYVWGREFMSKEPKNPRELEIDKHWYRFLMWGRLAYDPSLDDLFFQAKLQNRFPGVDADTLYHTWKVASQIVPAVNRYHWRDWDHMWSIETCMSKKEGYHSLDHFIEFGPLKSYGLSIPEFVKNPNQSGVTPVQAADELDQLAEQTLAGLNILSGNQSRDLRLSLADMRAFAYLAEYYADKIRAALELHRYRVHGKETSRQLAVAHLEKSIRHWRAYGEVASAAYQTQLLARVDTTDWLGELFDFAKSDFEILLKAQVGVFPETLVRSRINRINGKK